ncbi:hypothetical protein SK128_019933, partial [Halocaridina rubra]
SRIGTAIPSVNLINFNIISNSMPFKTFCGSACRIFIWQPVMTPGGGCDPGTNPWKAITVAGD